MIFLMTNNSFVWTQQQYLSVAVISRRRLLIGAQHERAPLCARVKQHAVEHRARVLPRLLHGLQFGETQFELDALGFAGSSRSVRVR